MSGKTSTLLNALDILELLSRAPQLVQLKDIALQLDLPESTTHRLLASMVERGYVRQRGRNGAYGLGWKVVTLARSFGSGVRIVDDLLPYMKAVLREVQQPINLAVLSNLQVMYLESVSPHQTISLYSPPGLLAPVHATGLGKALLAHQPAAELDDLLARLNLEAFTPYTITSHARLASALDEVRRQGYAVDRGEWRSDVHCVAAPIIDPDGRALAAISVSARTADLAPHWEDRIVHVLLQVTREANQHVFGITAPA